MWCVEYLDVAFHTFWWCMIFSFLWGNPYIILVLSCSYQIEVFLQKNVYIWDRASSWCYVIPYQYFVSIWLLFLVSILSFLWVFYTEIHLGPIIKLGLKHLIYKLDWRTQSVWYGLHLSHFTVRKVVALRGRLQNDDLEIIQSFKGNKKIPQVR